MTIGSDPDSRYGGPDNLTWLKHSPRQRWFDFGAIFWGQEQKRPKSNDNNFNNETNWPVWESWRILILIYRTTCNRFALKFWEYSLLFIRAMDRKSLILRVSELRFILSIIDHITLCIFKSKWESFAFFCSSGFKRVTKRKKVRNRVRFPLQPEFSASERLFWAIQRLKFRLLTKDF